MKIDAYLSGVIDKYIKQSKQEKTEKVNIRETKESQPQTTNKDVDKVEISKEAKLLSEVLGDDSSKAQRLEEVRLQLEKGTYKPPIDEIANAILKEWKGE